MNQQYPVCRCPHHKVAPIMVLLFAILFFFHNTFGWLDNSTVNIIWPILLFVAAGTKIVGSYCGCCSKP